MTLNPFKVSVDGILSTFTKTIEKLEAHSVDQVNKAEKKLARSNLLLTQRDGAILEAKRAQAAAGKLKTFFGE